MTLIDMFNRLTFGRALIIGFVITAFYYFIVFDDGEEQIKAAQNARSQVQSVQTEIQSLQVKLDQAHHYQNASQTLGKSINRLLEVIPSGFRVGDFMKTTSTEARMAGLQITRLNPAISLDRESIPEFSELGVVLEARGQYGQILKFMANLTKKRQIFTYKSISMVPDKISSAGNGLIILKADIRAYNYIGDAVFAGQGAGSAKN